MKMGRSKKKQKHKEELEHRTSRKIWVNKAHDTNTAIALIDQQKEKKSFHRTLASEYNYLTDVGCRTATASAALLHIRRAMLRHDWNLVRRLLSECYLDFTRARRSTVHRIMFQLFLSSPSNEVLLQEFCRMYLGVSSNEEVQIFLKVISTFPEEIPSGSTKYGPHGKLVVLKENKYVPANAYSNAAKRLLKYSEASHQDQSDEVVS